MLSIGLRKTYTHAESTAEVIKNDPGARIAGVIHLRLFSGAGRGRGEKEEGHALMRHCV